jgi:stress response protein YsnF
MWGFLALFGAGLVVGITLAFWAAMQNWMADVIDRARTQLGRNTDAVQSALVVLDRIIVNAQRVVQATARVFFREQETHKIIVKEEVRQMDRQALPAEILAKIEAGETISYELRGGTAGA